MTCASTFLVSGRVAVLAFESGRSLLLEQETCAQLARERKIAVAVVG